MNTPRDPLALLAERTTREIARQGETPLAAGLYVVATPIGNLGDITLRALTTLARADLILCEDTRHSRTLLAHFDIARPVRALHDHNEDAERERIERLIGEGRAIALISDAGTPLVSDPGYKLVRAMIASGHAVHVLPGPSAVLAGLTLSGLPTDTFLFAGFASAKTGQRRERLAQLAAVPATLVLFEAPGRVADLIADIAEILGDRPIAVARELTKRFEEVRRGTAAAIAEGLAEATLKGEIVVVVGPPVARVASDADITAALLLHLSTQTLKDAVRIVSDQLGAPRNRVYEIALECKDGDR